MNTIPRFGTQVPPQMFASQPAAAPAPTVHFGSEAQASAKADRYEPSKQARLLSGLEVGQLIDGEVKNGKVLKPGLLRNVDRYKDLAAAPAQAREREKVAQRIADQIVRLAELHAEYGLLLKSAEKESGPLADLVQENAPGYRQDIENTLARVTQDPDDPRLGTLSFPEKRLSLYLDEVLDKVANRVKSSSRIEPALKTTLLDGASDLVSQ